MAVDEVPKSTSDDDREQVERVSKLIKSFGPSASPAKKEEPKQLEGVQGAADPTQTGWSIAASSSGGTPEDVRALYRADPRFVFALAMVQAMLPRIKRVSDGQIFCRSLIEQAGRALDARTASICWYDEEHGRLDPVATYRHEDRPAASHELVHSFMQEALAHRELKTTRDLAGDPALMASSESRLVHPGVSAMAMGIFDGEKPLGALYMDRAPEAPPFEGAIAGRFLRVLAHDASRPLAMIDSWKREQREATAREMEMSQALSDARDQAESARREADKARRAAEEIQAHGHFQEMRAVFSRASRNVQRQMLAAAQAPTLPVLITGPVGSGKSFIAQQIHNVETEGNTRAGRPFVEQNCANLSGEKAESVLFGTVPGAYTGVLTKETMGLFRQADKGTLFLDEIGDLPLDTQAKVLIAIAEGRATPVGPGAKTYSFDVRVIAATNQDLDKMVEEKRFRSDLLSRLRYIEIYVPPLRERRADLLGLIDVKFEEIRKRLGKTRLKGMSRVVRSKLLAYEWKDANVRELEAVLTKMIVQADREQELLHYDDLPDRIRRPAIDSVEPDAIVGFKEAERRWRADYLAKVVLACEGSYAAAAKKLGIKTPSNLRMMVKKAGLDPLELSAKRAGRPRKEEGNATE